MQLTSMSPEFITYKQFNDPALADELAELFEGHDIAYTLSEDTSGFDPSMVMSNAPVDYCVKIKGEDFERADQLLQQYEERNIEGIGKDYYLFGFTDVELTGIMIRPEEWSTFDYVLARKILNERGNNISDGDIARLKKARIDELKTPYSPQTFWLIAGYMLALGGGILGFFIGWHLSTYKKTLPDGERVYGYVERDRKHGRWIFYLSFVGLAIGFIYKLAPVF